MIYKQLKYQFLLKKWKCWFSY